MRPHDDLTDPLEEELARLLAPEKPVPRPEFVRELDARVEARFPRRRPRWQQALWRPQFAVAATGLAAAVVAVVVVTGSIGPSKHALAVHSPSPNATIESAPTSKSQKYATPPTAAGAGPSRDSSGSGSSSSTGTPDAAGTGASGSAPTPSAVAPAPASGRRVERTTDLVLAVRRNGMQDAAQQVFGIVTAAGGIVQSSNVASGQGAGASFDLRIPASRVSDTVARLAKLGHVRSETNSTLDVTKAFTSLGTRLSDASAERRGLLRQLAKAVTANETASIKARLRLVEAQINSIQSQLRVLRTRTDYARVSLELVPQYKHEVVPAHHGSGLTPGRALHDAGHVLAVAGAVALLALIVALPVAVLALLAWLAARPVVRRRREHALDLA
jgi:hypothetical protein